MTSTPHTHCLHPATKAARAACRKIRAANHKTALITLNDILKSYYDNSTALEVIVGDIRTLAAKTGDAHLLAASTGYYDNSLDAEEVIAEAAEALKTL